MENLEKNSNLISCCFTGHRPEHLPWGRNEEHPACLDFFQRLTNAVKDIIQMGCVHFYCGMAQGVDMYAAQIVLGMRDADPEKGLRLIAVCPHTGQASRWSSKDKELHQLLLHLSDEVVIIDQDYSPACFHRRNRYMVDRCSYIIAGYDGLSKGGTFSTVAYAKRKNRQITIVPPV